MTFSVCSLAFFVTILATCLSRAASFPEALGEGFKRVTKPEQLWRFQVGPEWRGGASLGTEFVCMCSSHGKYVRAIHGGLHNDRTWCMQQERLKIEFAWGNSVRLRPAVDNSYVSCRDDNKVHLESSPSEGTIFRLFINENDDHLVFFNPLNKRFLSAPNSGKLTCKVEHNLADEQFRGWKQGPKSEWKATDRWDLIGTFENHASGEATFTYAKVTGVSIQKQKAASKPSILGTMASFAGLPGFFVNMVKTGIGYVWVKGSSKTWEDQTTIQATISVLPNKIVSLYQVVGTYGVYTIHTNYFVANETEVTEGPRPLKQNRAPYFVAEEAKERGTVQKPT